MASDHSSLLARIPDSPAGRQLRWYLGAMLDRGESSSLANYDHYAPRLRKRMRPASSDEDARRNWREWSDRFGAIEAISVRALSPFEIEANFTAAKARRWVVTLAVEHDPPHRMIRANINRALDPNVTVRKAVESDAAALAEIERRCPIVMGDTSMYFDRGADYFASNRLMEDATVGIVFVDGQPAAASCGALHRIRIGGVIHPLVTVTHLRVLPEHQRKGLWGAANSAFEPYFDDVDGSRAYISVDNAGMQHGFTNTPNKWSIPVYRAQLATAALAGPRAGKEATARDASRIVEILNRCHDREEQFLPYTVESFAARMTRSPRDYSWPQVWTTDRAVVGVWPAGESLKVVRESNGVRTESRPAMVLDYGFLPGGEQEFESLLRAWCGWANERGMDKLSIFTSDASPGHALLRSLAGALEGFFVWTPGIEEPPGAAAQLGVYVDPVYF